MNMRFALLVSTAIALNLPAWADEMPMKGTDILKTLTGARVEGSNWSQSFDAGGATIYAGADGKQSTGRWDVRGDEYCWARRASGSIVNILSVNAHCGSPELAIYSATKGALSTLTKNVANAHLADRIRVNGINMGWVATPAEQEMQAHKLGKGEDWAKAAAAGMPLGRLLTMDEVAQLALFLLSDASGLMTGGLIDLEQSVLGAPPRGRG